MAYDLNLLQALVGNPSETLSVEIKGWLDLKSPKHLAKVAKTLLALRNHGGGNLIFGIDGDTLAFDKKNPKPVNVREDFHTDKIQAIVGSYAAESFPIEVHFIETGGEVFPVVCVPPGIKTVVAAKENLMDDAGKPLIKKHQVYIRTLGANNTASTSEAQSGDWAAILETCMDNREADVARFLRRYFGERDVAGALQALGQPEADKLLRLQQFSLGRFNTVVDRTTQQVPNGGWWDVTAIVDGKVPERRCNQEFRNLVIHSNPRITGWPLWIDGQGLKFAKGYESPVDGFWENLLVMPPKPEGETMWPRNIDFWRISPKGEMYALRMLEDDLQPVTRMPPLIALDFSIVIWRTTEAILVPLAFAKAMGCDPDECSIGYLFTWSQLKGRGLTCWSNMNLATHRGKAEQDSVTSRVKVPLTVAPSAIAPYVHQVLLPLFELFGGTEINLSLVTSIVEKALKLRP